MQVPSEKPKVAEDDSRFAEAARKENRKDLSLIAIVSLLFIFVFLGKMPGLSSGQTPERELVGLIHVQGDVSHRSPGGTGWEKIHEFGKVYLKDFIYTEDNSTAEIEWIKGKSKLTLTPNTLVQIYNVSESSPEILLREGEVKSPVPIRILRGRRGTVAKALKEVTRAAVEAKTIVEAKPRVLAYDEIKTATIPTPAPVVAAQAQATPTPAPATHSSEKLRLLLFNPPNHFVSRRPKLSFSWDGIALPGISFAVDISQTDSFEKLSTYSTTRSSLVIDLGGEGIFFWRVRAVWRDRSVTSQTRTIRVGGKPPSITKDTSPPEMRVQEGLEKLDVSMAIRQHLGEVKHCYESALGRDPRTHGKLLVQFIISPQGTVKSAKTQTATTEESLNACVLKRLAKWKFPEPKHGVEVGVSYPFIFRSPASKK